jgi:uncharacterized membrane-anchored protein
VTDETAQDQLSDVLTTDVQFEQHERRPILLAEAHARPFHPASTPASFLHFAFTTDPARAHADRRALVGFCRARGASLPSPSAKHHRIELQGVALRWEQHTEFTTYTWEFGGAQAEGRARNAWMRKLPQPGPLMCCADLRLLPEGGADLDRRFGTAALAKSHADEDAAVIASDFQPDDDGFVRIAVADRALTPYRAGALVQRLLELETYRMFALLGLPEAQRLAPVVTGMEQELAELTLAMTRSDNLADNHELLQHLTGLQARLAAGAAASAYRFGASRAYSEIVAGRLDAIDERALPGFTSFSTFMSRRLAPAMRTCKSVERRQVELSGKLARATQLLRARIDIELQHQNVSLLESVNARGRAQLRLQMMVEALSIAAASYYVVGLVEHVARVLPRFGISLDVDLATAVAVPVVTLLIAAFFVLRLRSMDG